MSWKGQILWQFAEYFTDGPHSVVFSKTIRVAFYEKIKFGVKKEYLSKLTTAIVHSCPKISKKSMKAVSCYLYFFMYIFIRYITQFISLFSDSDQVDLIVASWRMDWNLFLVLTIKIVFRAEILYINFSVFLGRPNITSCREG